MDHPVLWIALGGLLLLCALYATVPVEDDRETVEYPLE